MQNDDILEVSTTPSEALEPCPMCAGRVMVEQLEFDWGPYDLRKSKFRCQDCGGLFEYAWRSSAYKRVPHAVEWFNTRRPAQVKECMGYDLQQLIAVAELLQQNEITVADLSKICRNLGDAVQIAERKFARDLQRHLQEYLAKSVKENFE